MFMSDECLSLNAIKKWLTCVVIGVLLTGCGTTPQTTMTQQTPTPPALSSSTDTRKAETKDYTNFTGDWNDKNKKTSITIKVDNIGNVTGSVKTAVGTHIPSSSIRGIIGADGTMTSDLDIDDSGLTGTITLAFTDSKHLKGNIKLDNHQAYWTLAEGAISCQRYDPDSLSIDNGNGIGKNQPYSISTATFSQYNIKIQYPQIKGLGDDSKEKTINDLIKNDVMNRQVEKPIKDYQDATKLTLELKYQVTMNTNELLSVLYTGYSNIEGSAHPNGDIYAITIELKNATKLRLSDFTTLDTNFVQKIKQSTAVTNEAVKDGMDKNDLITLIQNKDDQTLIRGLKGQWAYNTFYVTPNSLVVSVDVPHAAGDYALVELPGDMNKTVIIQKWDDIDNSKQTDESFFGQWVIKKLIASGPVGSYGPEDIKKILSRKLSFSAEKSSCFGDEIKYLDEVAINPVYKRDVVTRDDFATGYRYRLTFDDLGINNDSIIEVIVADSKNKGCLFYIKDNNTLILSGGGDFFELDREE